MSTEEAEYTAFTEASREMLWLRQILLDIEPRGLRKQPEINNSESEPTTGTLIYADNQAAIEHVDSEGITARTKHFDIRLKHLWDLPHKGAPKSTHARPSENTANIFTKGLPAPTHRRRVERLGLSDTTSEDTTMHQ